MQLIQTQTQPHTSLAPMIGHHAILVANAVRVWTDHQGKTHFEYSVVTVAQCDPGTCSHQGVFVVRGQRRAYTWARSSAFKFRCGDCGESLE